MEWFEFMLGVLATYTLALYITKTSGPKHMFKRLRNMPDKRSSLHEGIRCIWCVSSWASAVVTTYQWWMNSLDPYDAPQYWLALTAGSIMLNQAFTKDGK